MLEGGKFDYEKHTLYCRSFNLYAAALTRANNTYGMSNNTSASNEIVKDVIRGNNKFLRSAKAKNGKLSKVFWGSL